MPLPEQGDGPVADDYDEPEFEGSDPGYIPDDQHPEEQAPEPDPDGFAPFDITTVRPTATDENGKSGGLIDEEGNRLPEFDERYREDFEGLAFIGSLSKTFEWLGHRFVVRTLTVDELLAVSLLTKEFNESLGAGLAYRTAIASIATVTIDGQSLPLPVEVDSDQYGWALQRFRYARSRWFQFTIDAIYNEYLALEERTTKVVMAMGKAWGPPASTTG